ncbi:uncharacterized protein MONBRDRAFT_14006 [Monosiga brevicollis MX1]|uniref:L-2-hydroxyglutarate dehydrogenase, mitochondrial n=1 Tax=Monosiga brevicollis TaxID=81824 RepID=A9UPQ3_MONBE|nr:uncharacterized protein MONBRDRAFT_14006 [Monosiga brevicollis MX1]EDQ92464.1 predicted protein [Monosiga brevicollis MX1]|eukprot:XP_001742226.1 hypothetical protein [Monosiga brevicollis MX1]
MAAVRLSRGLRAAANSLSGVSWPVEDGRRVAAVIGGGIVGTAVARQLQLKRPDWRVVLLEKNEALADEQTGHNSGVIHSGVYYTPGSLKARLCLRGNELLYDFCAQQNIPVTRCGKLIVATHEAELPRLQALLERGQANGVPGLELLEGSSAVQAHEPHCAGIAAIHCPSTGIVDYRQVTQALCDDLVARGGHVYMGSRVERIDSKENEGVQLYVAGVSTPLHADYAIGCAGVYSDRLARVTRVDGTSSPDGTWHHLARPPPLPDIVPIRGEYLVLRENKRHLVRGNIYPVPDPTLPFLGVHFTPRMDGSLWLGPNAVPALARQGYSWRDISWPDLWDMVASRGYWRLAWRHRWFGLDEIRRSLDLRAQVRYLQRYIPDIQVDDVQQGPAGVRAQALDKAGQLVEDFVLETVGPNTLHVINAPSPAATSSLAIAEYVVTEAAGRLHWDP